MNKLPTNCTNCSSMLRTTTSTYPSVDQFFGICRDCRSSTWGTCDYCGNWSVPKGFDKSICSWCKYVEEKPILQPRAISQKKQYGEECPCGIKPSSCTYHS